MDDESRAEALLTDEDRRGLLRHMLLMRVVEERGVTLYKQGRIPGSFYDGRGQEAISVGATWALASGDPVCSPLIRDLGAHLVKGTDLVEIFRHYLGRENALSHGREGNIHFGDRTRGVVGPVSMLPDSGMRHTLRRMHGRDQPAASGTAGRRVPPPVRVVVAGGTIGMAGDRAVPTAQAATVVSVPRSWSPTAASRSSRTSPACSSAPRRRSPSSGAEPKGFR